MILVTGASGQLGSRVIEQLLKREVDADSIAALVRNTSDTTKLKEWNVNCRVADYNDHESLSIALQGIDLLVFISGNDFAHRMRQHQNLVDAAQHAGVKHIIYTSSIHGGNVLRPIIHDHLETEKLIQQSGCDYTMLRNNLYMENIAGYMGKNFLENGICYPAGNGKMAFISRDDIAEVIARVALQAPKHKGKEYEISNTESYSFHDIAYAVSQWTGKNVCYQNPSAEEYLRQMTGKLPEPALRAALLFGQAMAADEFHALNTDAEELLGHRPANLSQFLGTYSTCIKVRHTQNRTE